MSGVEKSKIEYLLAIIGKLNLSYRMFDEKTIGLESISEHCIMYTKLNTLITVVQLVQLKTSTTLVMLLSGMNVSYHPEFLRKNTGHLFSECLTYLGMYVLDKI